MASEQVVPFRVPAGEVVKLRPGPNSPGELSLYVIDGGPVFLWIERELPDAATALQLVTVDMEFDLAANAGQSPTMRRAGGVGFLSVYAEADSRGFLLHR